MAHGGEFFGLSGEAAQVARTAAGAGVGAAALIYLRHPGSLVRAVFLYIVSVGLAIVFTPVAVAWSGFGEVEVSASVALIGMAVARGFLKAIEGLNFAAMLPGKKGDV